MNGQCKKRGFPKPRKLIQIGGLVLVIAVVWYCGTSSYPLEVVEVSAVPRRSTTILARYQCNRPIARRIQIDRDPDGALYAHSLKLTTSTRSNGMYDFMHAEILPPEGTKWLWPFKTYWIRFYDCDISGEYSVCESPSARADMPFSAILRLGTLESRPFLVDKTAFTSAALERGDNAYQQGVRRILGSYGVKNEYLHSVSDTDHNYALGRHICSIDSAELRTLFPRIGSGAPSIGWDNHVTFTLSSVGVDNQSSAVVTLFIGFGTSGSGFPGPSRPLTPNDVSVDVNETSRSGSRMMTGEARAEVILPGITDSSKAVQIYLNYGFPADERFPGRDGIAKFVIAISDNLLSALHKP